MIEVERLREHAADVVFRLRRQPVHGGGHLQKFGACERHLPYATGMVASIGLDYLTLLSRLERAAGSGRDFERVRIIGATASTRGKRPNDGYCSRCRGEKQP